MRGETMTERQFLIDINPNIDLPEYNLVLYSLYEQPISELYNITNFNIKPFFIGIDEMSFNIPMTRSEEDGQIVRNEIYDMVDGEYYIKLNDSKFFVINKINEKTNDDGLTYKEVSAYSREAELNQKRLVDYRASSRMLYDRENIMLEDENGQLIERGILNYIFNHITKAWTIGTVDERVVSLTNQGISRALNFSNSSLIQVFQELQKTYNCVFKFNTITQVIDVESAINYDLNVEDIANSPQYKGLYISDENFIKNMSKNIEYDKVKTRLFLYGKDNVSIQNIHPTGQPYIDNLSTFKTTKFMTQELIDGLNAYELLVQNANPNFAPLLNQLQTKNAELEDLYNKDDDIIANKGLVALKRELSLVQTNIDTRVANLAIIKETIAGANGTDLSELHTQMTTIQIEIDEFEALKSNINSLIATKEDQIASKKDEIVSVENQIQGIRDSLSVQANLAPHLVKELDKFIRVEAYNDSNFTENNIMELYEEGKKNLAKISQPSIQFDVDVVDFLSIVECQHTWDKLVLGDIVLLENKNIGFSYYVRLVGYEHSPDNNSLNLKFSNTNSFDDATLWIKDLLEQMSNTTSTLDFNKYKWDKTENMQDRISKMVDEKLEEARQSILNAVGQRHLFDDSGLWLYKENPDGTIDNEQIRAINNTIALTEDNWATVGTAITPKGVVAEHVYGKLGEFAMVSANQIEVGSDSGNIIDYIETEIAESVDNLGDIINNAFADNKLTNIEANSIKLSLDNVTAESTSLISNATTLGITTERTNYSNALTTLTNYLNTNWLNKTYPLTITVTQRTNVTTYFKNLENKKSILLTKITEVREERANSYTDGEINTTKTEFKVTTDAISSKVTGIETDTSGLKTRMSSAENKITPNAITSTVESNTTKLATNSSVDSKVDSAKSSVEQYADGIVSAVSSTANSAYSRANSAISTANSAQSTANTANSNATTAITNASSAKQTADSITLDFSQFKTLASGQILGGGTGRTTINRDGVKVTHTGLGGQYSEMRADGFVRKWRYGEAKYLNDIYIATYSSRNYVGVRTGPITMRITFPLSFRGRNDTEMFLFPIKVTSGGGNFDRYGDVEQLTLYDTTEIKFMYSQGDFNPITNRYDRVITKDFNANPPWVDIQAYGQSKISYPDRTTDYFYDHIDFMVIAIGK